MNNVVTRDEPRALTGEQEHRYLSDGYLVLRPETLAETDHRLLYRRADELYDLSRVTESPTAHLDILGDNLRARIPEIDAVLTDPAIDGALTSLLGHDYLLHPHSYCHRSGTRDQMFHQDGNLPWNERGHGRSHRADWAMLFYYPQDVDAGNGPTEVVPGSQYWTVDHEKPDGTWHPGDRVDRMVDPELFADEDLELRDRWLAESLERGLGIPDLERRFLHVPAGTAVIAHYDLFHRGSRAGGHRRPRYMYKFYFARLHEPSVSDRVQPRSPGKRDGRTDPQPAPHVRAELRPVVEAQRRWLQGLDDQAQQLEPDRSVDVEILAARLANGREDQKVEAAYHLGLAALLADRRARRWLEDGLSAAAESSPRAAGHGLRQAGPTGVGSLLKAIDSAAATTRRAAVAGLGTTQAARSPEAIGALIRAVGSDPDDLVRSNAAYSLGQIGRGELTDPARLCDALLERLAPGAEPDNAFGAMLSRSTVRQSAALALVQLAANHQLPEDRLARLIEGPLQDTDRYVQGLVVEALTRAAPMPQRLTSRMLRYLAGRRWSPHRPPGPEPSRS